MNIAHLGHVELRTPKLEESVAFFRDIVGLEIALRTATSVYLRAWGDYEYYTLLTQADRPGLVQMALRVGAPEDVEAYAQHLEGLGLAVERIPGGAEPEQGEAIRFIGEGGHPVKLYYHMKKWDAGINKSLLISQAQACPSVLAFPDLKCRLAQTVFAHNLRHGLAAGLLWQNGHNLGFAESSLFHLAVVR